MFSKIRALNIGTMISNKRYAVGMLTLLFFLTAFASMWGCSSPSLEENAVFLELEQTAEENANLSRELNQTMTDNRVLSAEARRLKDLLDALQEENETLKTRLSLEPPDE